MSRIFVQLRYRDIQNGELSYVRQKTRHRTKSVRPIRAIVVPLMQEIIRKWGNPPSPNTYIFPRAERQGDSRTTENQDQNPYPHHQPADAK